MFSSQQKQNERIRTWRKKKCPTHKKNYKECSNLSTLVVVSEETTGEFTEGNPKVEKDYKDLEAPPKGVVAVSTLFYYPYE